MGNLLVGVQLSVLFPGKRAPLNITRHTLIPPSMEISNIGAAKKNLSKQIIQASAAYYVGSTAAPPQVTICHTVHMSYSLNSLKGVI